MSEVANQIKEITDSLARVRTEIATKLDDMQSAIDAGDEDDVQAALDALRTQVQGLDDLAPPVPEPDDAGEDTVAAE